MSGSATSSLSPLVMIIIIVGALLTIGSALFVIMNNVQQPTSKNTTTQSQLAMQSTPVVQPTGYLEVVETESMASPTAAQPLTVVWQDGAFNPTELSISVGTTIEFVNEDNEVINVATGEHDAHDGLFDSGELTQGQSFSYTFTTAGSWQVHNHFHPDNGDDHASSPMVTVTVQ